MIPVRVDPAIKPHVVATKMIYEDHPLFGKICPACDQSLNDLVSLVFIGRDSSHGGSTWTGSAVAVHARCTGDAA
jgi:hypothetical protein